MVRCMVSSVRYRAKANPRRASNLRGCSDRCAGVLSRYSVRGRPQGIAPTIYHEGTAQTSSYIVGAIPIPMGVNFRQVAGWPHPKVDRKGQPIRIKLRRWKQQSGEEADKWR